MLQSWVDNFIYNANISNEDDFNSYLKEKLSNFYIVTFSIVLIFPIASSIYRASYMGWQPIFTLHLLLGAICFIVFFNRKHLDHKHKSFLLISLFYIAGVAGLMQFGLLSFGLLLFTIACILSFILLTLRSFCIVACLTIISLILIGIYYPDGIIRSGIDLNYYVQARSVWVTATLSYSLLLITILSGVGIILYSLYGILHKVVDQKNKLNDLNIELEKVSITDKMTQAVNRLGIDNSISNGFNRLKRYNHSFGVILLDIDHFKKINDTYGHHVGDLVLVNIVNILKENTRNSDIVGRWGGEEFIIICPEIDKGGIQILAETLRSKIETHEFEIVGNVTSSFGVAIARKKGNQDTLLKRVDNALYQAKNTGRNRVCEAE